MSTSSSFSSRSDTSDTSVDGSAQCSNGPCCAQGPTWLCTPQVLGAPWAQCLSERTVPTPANPTPAPHPVFTCVTCRQHGVNHIQTLINGFATAQHATVTVPQQYHHSRFAHRSELCNVCTKKELKIYFQRTQRGLLATNITRPPLPADLAVQGIPLHLMQPSLQRVQVWPWNSDAVPTDNLPAVLQDQDLCICEADLLDPVHAPTGLPQRACHPCRRVLWGRAANERAEHERILGRCVSTVASGHYLRQSKANTVAAATLKNPDIARKAAKGVDLLCPCGRKPKAPPLPAARIATICLVCMGVQINAQNITQQMRLSPATLRRDEAENEARARGLARNIRAHPHQQPAMPHQIQKPWLRRVNIRRKWLSVADDNLMED